MAKRKQARIRRSEHEWRQILAEYAVGDQTQQQFCEELGIPLSTFARWKRLLSDSVASEPADDQASFIDLGALSGSDSQRWEIELELGDGVRLRLSRG